MYISIESTVFQETQNFKLLDKLLEYFESRKHYLIIEIQNEFMRQLGIHKVVVYDKDFPEIGSKENAQMFEINLKSDSDFIADLNEDTLIFDEFNSTKTYIV